MAGLFEKAGLRVLLSRAAPLAAASALYSYTSSQHQHEEGKSHPGSQQWAVAATRQLWQAAWQRRQQAAECYVS